MHPAFRFALPVALSLPLLCSGQNALQNGSFADSSPWLPGYTFMPNLVDGWTADHSDSAQTAGGDWYQNTGIANTADAYGVEGGTNGVLALYNLGSVSQSVSIGGLHDYQLSWKDAAPAADDLNGGYMVSTPEVSGLRYAVSINEVVLGQFTTVVGRGWAIHSISLSLTPGEHTVKFFGLDAGETITFGGSNQYNRQSAVHVGLFDDVMLSASTPRVMSAVPEPITVQLMLGGAAVVGWVVRRRRAAGSRA